MPGILLLMLMLVNVRIVIHSSVASTCIPCDKPLLLMSGMKLLLLEHKKVTYLARVI